MDNTEQFYIFELETLSDIDDQLSISAYFAKGHWNKVFFIQSIVEEKDNDFLWDYEKEKEIDREDNVNHHYARWVNDGYKDDNNQDQLVLYNYENPTGIEDEFPCTIIEIR